MRHRPRDTSGPPLAHPPCRPARPLPVQTCHGSGVEMKLRALGPGMVQQIQQRCSRCGGGGYSCPASDRCTSCDGKGLAPEKKVFEVRRRCKGRPVCCPCFNRAGGPGAAKLVWQRRLDGSCAGTHAHCAPGAQAANPPASAHRGSPPPCHLGRAAPAVSFTPTARMAPFCCHAPTPAVPPTHPPNTPTPLAGACGARAPPWQQGCLPRRGRQRLPRRAARRPHLHPGAGGGSYVVKKRR